MTTGKFAADVAVRQVSRWEFTLLEPLAFDDSEHGLIEVPTGFTSDLASIRILREICRWAAVAAVLLGLFLAEWPWASALAWTVAVVALALYGLVVGYGMRSAILHDWLYTKALLARAECDSVFSRALRTGDGTARWRAWLFYAGVRIGGAGHYGTA
ncbi:DUF1353 domain-containing protein [Pseudomonas typographi]|uniref:DUF1353 domain-containing protein n=1 Tax=Pseudomonas typographi TaxID=2715964 RepID=UPI001689ED29|nr:DUF1353 domain-containing protein [Pseudomonas typographi]MBD1554753.1 DUF1353 domain-containing protein [Pseudomonas typographi]